MKLKDQSLIILKSIADLVLVQIPGNPRVTMPAVQSLPVGMHFMKAIVAEFVQLKGKGKKKRAPWRVFLVSWRGYEQKENTLEPLSNICDESLLTTWYTFRDSQTYQPTEEVFTTGKHTDGLNMETYRQPS